MLQENVSLYLSHITVTKFHFKESSCLAHICVYVHITYPWDRWTEVLIRYLPEPYHAASHITYNVLTPS